MTPDTISGQAGTVSKPRLIIHIGDPKTGTTSIQQALQEGNVQCDTRRILPWESHNAVSVADSLKPNRGKKATPAPGARFSKVARWITASDADIAVLSSEFFSSVRPRALDQALREHVPQHAGTARVISYVRPHASRFLAAYVQRTKTGRFFGDFDSFMDETQKTDMFRYADRFGRWNRVFGNRFTLKPFIRSELRDGDIVRDFFAGILDDEPFSVSGTVEVNVAVHLRALAGIRHVQRLFKEHGIEDRERGFLGRAIANHFLPRGRMDGDRPRLDRATAKRLISTYSEDARQLDEAFFDRPLMQEELAASADKAGGDPIDLASPRYFSASQRNDLDRLGAELVELFRTRSSQPWMSHMYSCLLGAALKPGPARKVQQSQAHIAMIDSRLSEISDILRT